MINFTIARLAQRLLVLAFAFGVLTHISFAQCGTYFHPGYRAIGKNVIVNDSYFRLDDWTGDGKSDYWNLQPNGPTTNILIYPSKPTGYWDWDNPIVYTTTMSGGSLFRAYPNVQDFDGDGLKDLRYGSRIYRNTGNGSLETQAQITMAEAGSIGSSSLVRYVDITGDGRLDWVYSVYKWDTTREIRYQPGMPDGSFGAHVTIFGPPSVDLADASAVIGDYNGDGKSDFMLIKRVTNTTTSFAFVKGLGNGTFETGSPTNFDVSRNSLYVADINSDGRLDILTQKNNNLAILHAQADGSLILTEYPGIQSGLSAVVDLNGDSKLDIFTLEDFSAGVGYGGYRTTINNGSGGYVQTSYTVDVPLSVLGLRIEDVSGDGKVDIFEYSANARDSSAGHIGPRNLFGQDVTVVWTNTCARSPFKIPSFTADRQSDIAMWDPNNGGWGYRNLGYGIGNSTAYWGTSGDVPAPGDFDGDDIYDFTVYRDNNGTWYSLNSSNGAWNVMRFGLPGDKPVPNDYDGDSRTDIAVFRPSDGTWHIWLVGPQEYRVMRFGANGDKPVPADYDGDFKTDIGVYRPSDGTWYYVRSSDQGIGIQRWGVDTDVPIPWDYDGDAKADIAVFRSGDWYIIKSSDANTTVFRYGIAGDIPVAINHQLFTTLAMVYRPSNRKWYGYTEWIAPTSTAMPVRFGLPNN